jgi:hypothetical protein
MKDKQMTSNLIKIEALYMTLSGYARECTDMKDNSLNGEPYKIALAMNKKFSRIAKLYSPYFAEQVIARLRIWDTYFKDTTTAPSILLVLTLDYLLNVAEHTRTKVHYGHLKSDIARLFNEVEASEYKQHLYKHMDMIDTFMKE